jgi:hypothetical protein
MRCTNCSSAMTPSQTRRRGRLYRYYVCLGASRRGHDTCPVRSIAASEVEGLVLGQVRRLLASPELVARTIAAARRENGADEDMVVEEGDVPGARHCGSDPGRAAAEGAAVGRAAGEWAGGVGEATDELAHPLRRRGGGWQDWRPMTAIR